MNLIVGFFLLAVTTMMNLLVVVTTRYAVARALGIAGVGFFRVGPEASLEGAPRWARLAFVVAGAVTAYAVAATLFLAASLTSGELANDGTIDVAPGRPAEAAGLRNGDRVLSIAGARIGSWEAIAPAVQAHPGEAVEFLVERGGAEQRFQVTPGAKGTPGEGKIGVVPARVRPGLGTALAGALVAPAGVLVNVVRSFLELLTGSSEPVELAGPVAIAAETGRSTTSGIGATLRLLGALDAYFWPGIVVLIALVVPRRARRQQPHAAAAR